MSVSSGNDMRLKKRDRVQAGLEDFSPGGTRKKHTACHACHARKVKCSGGEPCANCSRSSHECTYPVRNHKITVTQSYIDNLLRENQNLRGRSPSTSVDVVDRNADDASRNPLLDDEEWFVSLSTSSLPVRIGEAADTAFATRLRQVLAEPAVVEHIPRTLHVTDEELSTLSSLDCPWPTLARARLLVRFATDTVGQCYHCTRRSQVLSGLEKHYQNDFASTTLFAAKLWALFAIGEVYSFRAQSTAENVFPGLLYFARAANALRRFAERPQIDYVEVLLLMSLYSLLLNRRFTSYLLAGSAVRNSIVMGLHYNVPESQLPDRAAREHRLRIWWTAYTLDRVFASKMAFPPSIPDDDIDVDLPSSQGLSESDADDFLDAEYANATIRLARLSRAIITSIYNRKTSRAPFSQRVQKALKDLKNWVAELPSHLQIDAGRTAPPLSRPVKWLHLSFNQYVILATRPVLLHIFRAHKPLWSQKCSREALKEEIGETALALAEACIRCARHSHRLLTESWIDGSFATFDYTYTQYLFSATLILAISSLSIGRYGDTDKDNLEAASQFLEQLKSSGNFAATEFCQHLHAVKSNMLTFSADSVRETTIINDKNQTSFVYPSATQTAPHGLALTPSAGSFQGMTTEMALAEPSLEDFLSQADFNLGFLDAQQFDDQFRNLYCPTFEDETWNLG